MFISEIIVSLLLIIITLAFLFTSSLLMPMNLEMLLVIGLITLFIAFAGMVWKEQPKDERDNMHRLHAGRVSYLVGLAMLVIGIVQQSLTYEIDPWLIATVVAMVSAKIIARIYSQLRN